MFGQNLKKLRTSKNLSQSKLSKILGISSSTIGMYEQGRRFPDQTILTKIADFFDVSTDYLLGRNPQNPPTEFNNATDAMEFILKLPTVMAWLWCYKIVRRGDNRFRQWLIATNRIN